MKHNAKKRSLNCQNIADGRRFFLLLFLILICCLLSFSAFASDQKIRVGYYPVDNFQEYSESTGSYRGYSYDYMLAIAQYAGWSYEFVPVSADAGLDMEDDISATWIGEREKENVHRYLTKLQSLVRDYFNNTTIHDVLHSESE